MKWLEVINLRAVGNNDELLNESLRRVANLGHKGLAEMKTYCHAALETDLSVLLHWESERPDQNGSPLGLRLAQALKEFGLIDHSVGIEEEEKENR